MNRVGEAYFSNKFWTGGAIFFDNWWMFSFEKFFLKTRRLEGYQEFFWLCHFKNGKGNWMYDNFLLPFEKIRFFLKTRRLEGYQEFFWLSVISKTVKGIGCMTIFCCPLRKYDFEVWHFWTASWREANWFNRRVIFIEKLNFLFAGLMLIPFFSKRLSKNRSVHGFWNFSEKVCAPNEKWELPNRA